MIMPRLPLMEYCIIKQYGHQNVKSLFDMENVMLARSTDLLLEFSPIAIRFERVGVLVTAVAIFDMENVMLARSTDLLLEFSPIAIRFERVGVLVTAVAI